MNGKTGSRLIVRVRPRGGAAVSFKRDVLLLASFAQSEREKKALLWLEPNTGQLPIAYHTLAPSLYIDCARRVRLTRQAGVTACLYATADKPRVNADASAGITGDPYAPIKSERDASITPKRETFGYKGIARVLKADLPLLSKLDKSDEAEGLSINLSALVRRGGTDTNTDGFFDRRIRTSRVEEAEAFDDVKVFDRVGNVAKARADEAGEAGSRLRHALTLLVQGGPDKEKRDDKSAERKVDPWVRRFDVLIDRVFFDDALWAEAAGEVANHRLAWRERLRTLAGTVFAEAAEAAPRTEMRRIRAITRSRTMLDAQMAKWIKEIA